MRKLFWVLLGMMIATGAIGLASYRHFFEPQRASVSRSADRSFQQQPRATAPAAESRRPTYQGSSGTTIKGWKAFEIAVNVLNVVVGVFGIWMTLHGLRLQREALAATRQRL